MRRLVMLAALLIVGSAAMAQNAGTGSSQIAGIGQIARGADRSSPAARRSGAVEKNLSDPNSQANREDAALDRKIKSICRGC